MTRKTTDRRSTRPTPAWLWALGLAVCGWLLAVAPAPAAAQQLPDLQLQRFRPAAGPSDFLDTYSTGTADKWEPSGAFYLDIADGPLRIQAGDSRDNEVVNSQLTASFLANLGLPYGFEAGLLIPTTLLQTSEDLSPVSPPGATGASLSPQAINDIRLTTKYQIFDLLGGDWGLAAVGNFYVPVGTRGNFATDRGVSFDLLAAAETWLWQGSRIGANLGYRFRSQPAEVGPATMGDELLWSVAANIPLFVRKVDLVTEFNGGLSIAHDTNRTGNVSNGEGPTEFRTAARVALSSDWVMTLGFGSRLGDGVGVPDVRGFVGIGSYWISGGNYSFDFDDDGIYGEADLCPRETEDVDRYKDDDGCADPDNDGDGVLDVNDECRGTPKNQPVNNRGCVENDIDGDGLPNDDDQCPHDPEDHDDFEDDDGCPDPDNDRDGISDLADECPNEKETVNEYRDEDGCPDEPGENVRVTDGKIVLNHKIHFEVGKAEIQNRSHKVLDELAGLIDDNPEINLLRVEGHTDNQGGREMNRKLSQRRAESVRNYLVNQGVSPERLAATGFGEREPIASNDTEEGRRKNRRVEFNILKRSDSED